jgi:hypothetical protein
MNHMMLGRDSRITRSALWILLSVLAGSSSALAGTWEIGIVNGSVGGEYSSLQFDKYGNAHVAYTGDGLLQYSFWDHNLKKWFTTQLDRSGGFTSLALDSKQHPHISYNHVDNLNYAHWDGSAWQIQTIPLPSKMVRFYTSIALDSKDNPSIGYYEILDAIGSREINRMRVVTWNGSGWQLTTADHDFASGKFNSLAIDSHGRPHVAYCNVVYETASLRYAYWDGTSWRKEIIEGGERGVTRQSPMLVLDKNDIPHIAYSDLISNVVKYATRVNGKWQIQVVDFLGMAAFPDRNGLAFDEKGTPYISFYDEKRGVLKLAYRTEKGWVSRVLDGDSAGFTSSIQIHDGTIWLTYSAGTGAGLKFARGEVEATGPESRPNTPPLSK